MLKRWSLTCHISQQFKRKAAQYALYKRKTSKFHTQAFQEVPNEITAKKVTVRKM
jgi:HEPN domain-containing protein